MSNGFIMVGVLSGGYSLFSVGCLTGVGVCGIIISSTNRNLVEAYKKYCAGVLQVRSFLDGQKLVQYSGVYRR